MNADINPEFSAELKQRAMHRTLELLRVASHRFDIDIAEPTVRFDLRGKAAGQAHLSPEATSLVRYNLRILLRYPEDFLAATVPHETAHLVAFRVFGHCIRPHGDEWKAIMHLYGAEPRRCHGYDVMGLETRHLRRYGYRCNCRAHQVSSIRHNRILSGQIYLCRCCGRPLERVVGGEEKPRV